MGRGKKHRSGIGGFSVREVRTLRGNGSATRCTFIIRLNSDAGSYPNRPKVMR